LRNACLQDQQILERSLSDAYQSFSYESPGLRSKEIRNKSHDEAAKTLSKRLSQIQEQTAHFNDADWEKELVEKAKARAVELAASWDVEGDKYCDAKRILEELHGEYRIRMPLIQFKRRIVRAMARRHAPKLEELKAQIRRLLEA
jgi:hypothetical protein